ncbi:putative choline transporter, neither null mutation nor overexpression affects choline transport [Linnemannia elongata]|nr:putative choline transporter, neither null mutation nor overexpression affects choline transport [Linnemannia elongata]
MAEYYHLPDKSRYLQQQHPVPYGVYPQPTYQPHHLQGRWGHDQVAQQYAYSGSPLPPPQTSWASSPPANSPQQQSSYPEYELASIGHQAPPYGTGIAESEKPEKFKPAPKYNDLWTTFAFLIQMAGFIALSAFAVNNIIKAGLIKSGEKGIIEKDFFLSADVMVLTNIVHVTVSGVFATHYFKPESRSPTWACLKRACTTSFGTICFGGLIYAIIQTIKEILDVLRGDDLINEALEFITPLVYCEVAIYGKPFVPAAKDGFKVAKDRGLDLVLKDIIISTVWSIGAFFGAFVAAVGCQYYLMMTMGGEGADNVKTHALEVWIVTGLTFFLGMQIIFTAGAVIQSGVATIFVALAEDPDALAETKPELFAKIQAAFPDIVQGDHQ